MPLTFNRVMNLTDQASVRCLLAFGAGALSVLAYAPFQWWWLSPVTFALVLTLTQRTAPEQRIWPMWFAFGLGKFLIGSSWLRVSMIDYGGLSLPLSMLVLLIFNSYQALYPFSAHCAATAQLARCLRTCWLFPPLWL